MAKETISNEVLAEQYLRVAVHIDQYARQQISQKIRTCPVNLSELASERGSLVRSKEKTPGIGPRTRDFLELIVLHGPDKANAAKYDERTRRQTSGYWPTNDTYDEDQGEKPRREDEM